MKTKAQLLATANMVRAFAQRSAHHPQGTGVQEFCDELASCADAVELVTMQDRRQRVMDLYAKGPEGMQEIAAAMMYTINQTVLAQNFAMAFLQMVSLKNDEWPVLKYHKRDGKMGVRYIGQEPIGAPKHQFIDRQTHAQFLMNRYSSDLVEYPLYNIQTGDLAELDRVVNEVSYKFARGLDALAITLLDSMVMASGLRATLDLDSGIVAANIPDANYLDLSGTNPGVLTLAKMKLILAYFVSFGADVELDGSPLSIGTIVMSSKRLPDIWDWATVVAAYTGTGSIVIDPKDTIPTDAKLAIWNNGSLNSLFGQNFKTMTVNTIASNILYVSSNKPSGLFFDKPGFSETITDTDARTRLSGKGVYGQTRVQQLVAPGPWNYRTLKVKV